MKAAGILLLATVSFAAAAAPQPNIYYSAAPWDEAAYALTIPLSPSAQAAEPVLNINIWDNPEFLKGRTIRFSGKEDPGGGPDKGLGRASYQAVANKSLPENLAGSITFDVLLKGKPVSGRYDLKALDGKRRFRGRFRAVWGNEPPKAIR